MSQTEVQLIKADAVQTTDIANSAVTDAKISAVTSSKLTGALPAVSAANLTNIPAANLTGTLPAISGANLTGISGGITEADHWRINTSFTGDSVPISANWERADRATFEGKLGTGLTESSGVFSFPSTGWYFCIWHHYYYASGDSPWNEMGCAFSNDSGANWTDTAHTEGWYERSGTAYTKQSCSQIFDITNISTQRMRFRVDVDNNSTATLGNTNTTHTGFQIIRLGDT